MAFSYTASFRHLRASGRVLLNGGAIRVGSGADMIVDNGAGSAEITLGLTLTPSSG